MKRLEVKNLTIAFGGRPVVKGINFHVARGEALGIVGESGCGKSVTAQALVLPVGTIQSGAVYLDGENLFALTPHEMQKIRRTKVGMVFQEPMTALNPLMPIGKQLTEGGRASIAKAEALLRRVGIHNPPLCMRQYPHELSGGMRQRALIAMALACDPQLLIADEPTTALDVTVQAELLQLLHSLKEEMNLSLLFISHDLGVIEKLCSRVLVMHQGEIVEEGPVASLFATPQHPYTRQLLSWRRRK